VAPLNAAGKEVVVSGIALTHKIREILDG